jgi:hypothetical protein
MARLLTTDTVDARDRLAYWNEAVSDAYVRLSCDAPAAAWSATSASIPSPRWSSPG